MTEAERAAWLEERKKGLGSSDMPAILGANPRRCALAVYLNKIGELPEQDDNEAMKSGRMLEDVVATMYSERTGRYVYRPANRIEWAKSCPFLFASIDRWTSIDDIGEILECKTSRFGDGYGEDGTDEVSPETRIQVLEQMYVTGKGKAEVALLVGGQELRCYTVERDELAIKHMLEVAGEFWRRVCERDAPPYDWEHPATPTLFKVMNGRVNAGEVIRLDGQDIQIQLRQYVKLREELSTLGKLKEVVAARIQEAMGTAEIGVTENDWFVKRAVVHRKAYTVPATIFTQLTVKEPKGA